MINKTLKSISVCSLVCVLFLIFFHPIEMGDVWWHLKTGQWIVENGEVPQRDPFSLGQTAAPWIFTQWLGSTALYGVYHIAGDLGLKVFRSLFFLGVGLMFFFSARRKVPLPALLWLLYFLSLGLDTRSFLRPLIFNFIFIQLTLNFLFSYQKERKITHLVPIPLMGILWFNLHLGSFVYGGLLIFIFLLCESIEYCNIKFSKTSAGSISRSVDGIKALLLTLLSFFALFIVNPYGLRGALYPFKVFLFSNFINFYKFNTIVAEMQPPVFILGWSGVWFFFLLLSAVILLIRNKNRTLTHVLLLIAAVFLFFQGARGGAFFALVSATLIAECAGDLSWREKWKNMRFVPVLERSLYVLMILIFSLHSIKLLNGNVVIDGKPVRNIELVHEPHNPHQTLQYLNEWDITGRVLLNSHLGGYLLFKSYPRYQPIVDGRQLDQELYSEFLSVMYAPERHWEDFEKKYFPTIVLIDAALPNTHALLKVLQTDKTWELILLKGSLVTFVKKGVHNLNENILQFEKQLKSITYSEKDIEILKTFAGSRNVHNIREYLFPPPYYIDSTEEALNALLLDYKGAGIQKLIESTSFTSDERTRWMVENVLKMMNNDKSKRKM